MKKLRDETWPDLAELMFDLLVASPTTRLLIEMIPTQANSLMWPVGHLMSEWRDKQEIEEDFAAGYVDDDENGEDRDRCCRCHRSGHRGRCCRRGRSGGRPERRRGLRCGALRGRRPQWREQGLDDT